MRYTSCLMPMHLALHSIAAECGVHAKAMGVHPGIQGMAPHFPDTQMHAGMHAGMHTSMHFLVRPDALMRYTSCLLALHCIAAECGVHATAMGVHPGIQGMAPHFPDTQMHAGMHAGMHTSMHFLVRADALMRYASCLMPHAYAFRIAFGRRSVACMQWLWACIQAPRGCLCTRLHAGMHAYLVAL